MALISAKTILTSFSLFHITLGFFFITSPGTIAGQSTVYLLGEAMGLPHASVFDTPSPALALLGVILALTGICDLVTLSLPEEISLLHHWGMQAPLRFVISFALALYAFFLGASSPLYANASPRGRLAHPSASAHNPAYRPAGWGGDLLKNRVFFTFVFLQSVGWLWVWVTLREERGSISGCRSRGRDNYGPVEHGLGTKVSHAG